MTDHLSLKLSWREGAPTPPPGAVCDGHQWLALDGFVAGSNDAALLAALRRDGRELVKTLDGAFAFLWWNGEALLMARDAMGQRPLHYRMDEDGLTVASLPLDCLPDRQKAAVDFDALADFMLLLDEDDEHSFIAGVNRLGAGEWAVATRPDRVEVERWWRPDLSPVECGIEEAQRETQRLLDRAIGQAVEGQAHVALGLSAGLDSNLLLSRLGRERKVTAICGVPMPPVDVPRGGLADESGLAGEAAAAMGVGDFIVVEAPSTGLRELEASFEQVHRPLHNPANRGWMDAVVEQAKDAGASVLLHGLAGNFTVSWGGDSALSAAVFHRRWRALGRSLRHREGMTVAIREALRDHTPLWLRKKLASRGGWNLATEEMVNPDDQVVARRLKRLAVRGLFADRPEHRSCDPQMRLDRWLLGTDLGNLNHAIGAQTGLSYRDPYCDRQLVQWCLRLPSEHYSDGTTHRLLAKALLDPRIPAAIRGEDYYGVQGQNWRQAAERDLGLARELIDWARGHERLRSMLRLDEMAALIAHWPEEGWETGHAITTYRVRLQRQLTAIAFTRWVEER